MLESSADENLFNPHHNSVKDDGLTVVQRVAQPNSPTAAALAIWMAQTHRQQTGIVFD